MYRERRPAVTPVLWLRLAWRDLRSGLKGFWVFLACLALGTASIAVVGALAAAIERGIAEQGQPLLGGDMEFALIHREAREGESAWLAEQGAVSKVGTMRAMASTGESTVLVELKAVDRAYPLFGRVELEDSGDFREKLKGRGALIDGVLLQRLGTRIGERIRLGGADFELRGVIANEPDRLSHGILFGPRVLIAEEDLGATGLVQPGSLITWRYRVKLPGEAALSDVKARIEAAARLFPDAGWNTRSRDSAAQGADRFIDRLSYFLILVGLTALIVGGAGIANAVSAFVARRTGTIAILKCVGAPASAVFGIYLTEILLVCVLGLAIGLAAGAAAPPLAGAFLAGILPLPLSPRIEVWPLLQAAAYGILVTLAFALWPLARTRQVSAASLFRHRVALPQGRPRLGDLAAIAAALLLICALAFASFDDRRITAYFLGGLALSLVALWALARGIVWAAAHLPVPASAVLRYALGNLHRPGSAAASTILALGLGLTLFVTLALTDGTIRNELMAGIPKRAPAFYLLDIRNQDRDALLAAIKEQPEAGAIGMVPMLRGRIVKVKDQPADKVSANPDVAWALRGDRGLTYADALPEGSRLAAGSWWPADYSGEPLVSFVDEVAIGLGLAIGDLVTVNVLGRDITARIANLRSVDWRSFEINFVMVFSPNTLKAAPHQFLATVEMPGSAEAPFLNRLARDFPTVTAVRVRDVVTTVSELLAKMLAAIRGANGLTLLTGILVLSGALAAGLESRIYDAAVLKTYGATPRQLIAAFAAEYAILGLASAIFGVITGSFAAWFLAYWILEMPWHFSPAVALLTALIAVVVTVAAGLIATWRALAARPAPLLRDE
jgi:putative ABC transport system permease protein